MQNVLENKLGQNWRNYYKGVKVRKPLGGDLRAMGKKRLPVLPNNLYNGRTMTFSFFPLTANFAFKRLSAMTDAELSRLSPGEWERLKEYEKNERQKERIRNERYSNSAYRAKLDSSKEARSWVNTARGVIDTGVRSGIIPTYK